MNPDEKDLKKVAEESGTHCTQWPMDFIHPPGILTDGKEKTVIPEIRNDGKKYNGESRS